jgi:histidinol dehydrogenase
MPIHLTSSDPDFESAFARFLSSKREVAEDVEAAARAIIQQVRAEGDKALIALTQRFDRAELAGPLRVGEAEIAAAVSAIDRETLAALELARSRIESHHRRQYPRDERYRDAVGAEIAWRWTAIAAVGLYVPGGLASYPSSVLMNAVPAKVAGVERIAMAAPAPAGEINPLVLAAAHLAGVSEIYRVGGAQAIAALAYGTESIAPVAKIVGPGNAYVAAAKRQVFGVVGIDSIAGPSEVLVIADTDNDPDWLAADLLAQAEHDPAAQAILMTDDAAFAELVAGKVAGQLQTLQRGDIAAASWANFGAVIVLRSLEEAPALADRIAPEHLEIATRDPERLALRITNAGAIFLGAQTPEAIGDYVAGSNHVLPTARSARFSSGLGVLDFMKRTSILKLDAQALRSLGPAAMTLARAEGLEAHRRSVAIRLGRGEER